MLIEQVTAHAFGPLREQVLELAEGLTVVYGPNEAGKSSWLAAIYAALCGRRRGAGRTGPDREFEDRHRPWVGALRDAPARGDGSGATPGGPDLGAEWAVSAQVRLADGRRIELRRDLARNEAQVVDLALGRDCRAEIMHDGAPDGARWLGLDRRCLLATAFVRQGDMLRTLDEAGGLQHHLQRAAATGRDESTAAAALARIEAFRREHIGSARAASRPLARAQAAVDSARAALAAARAEHEEYQRRRAEVLRLRAQAEATQRLLLRQEAAAARQEAQAARARAGEATRLAQHLQDLPLIETDLTGEAREVVAALARRDAVRQLDAGADTVRPIDMRLPRVLIAAASLLALLATAVALSGGPAAIAVAGLATAAVLAGVAVASVRQVTARAASGAARAALAAQARTEADEQLVATARRLGLPAATGDEAANQLAEWQQRREAATADAEQARNDQARLAALLAGTELATLVAAADEAEARARQAQAAGGFREDELRSVEPDPAPLREAASQAWQELKHAEGSLSERASRLPSIAEAEEHLARGERELSRLRALDETLARTAAFLQAAQERSHRDIAPVLAESVHEHLAAATAGRYTDVAVDPASLQVHVCGPDRRWRRADRLSHGTAEQVYLLLRIALARHLVAPEECAPLVLDDVVVHADAQRAAALLALLQQAAQQGQIVLFTHDDRVRDWARANLAPPRHALRELGV